MCCRKRFSSLEGLQDNTAYVCMLYAAKSIAELKPLLVEYSRLKERLNSRNEYKNENFKPVVTSFTKPVLNHPMLQLLKIWPLCITMQWKCSFTWIMFQVWEMGHISQNCSNAPTRTVNVINSGENTSNCEKNNGDNGSIND